jgi:hypothetical protein
MPWLGDGTWVGDAGLARDIVVGKKASKQKATFRLVRKMIQNLIRQSEVVLKQKTRLLYDNLHMDNLRERACLEEERLQAYKDVLRALERDFR